MSETSRIVARTAFGARRHHLIESFIMAWIAGRHTYFGAGYWAEEILKTNDAEIEVLGGKEI